MHEGHQEHGRRPLNRQASHFEYLLPDAVQLSVVEGIGDEVVDLYEVTKACSEVDKRGIKVLIDDVELGGEVGWRFLALADLPPFGPR